MKFTIDRFEGEFAIVELDSLETIEIPRIILPYEAKEGDIISIEIDEDETEARRKKIQEKFNSLFGD